MPGQEFPSEAAINRAAAILLEAGAREVYVFGSRARGGGGGRADSDLDLAVAGLPRERLMAALGRVMAETSFMVDLIELERETAFVAYLKSRGELRRVA